MYQEYELPLPLCNVFFAGIPFSSLRFCFRRPKAKERENRSAICQKIVVEGIFRRQLFYFTRLLN